MLLGKVLSIVAASAALLDGSMKAALPDKNMEGTMFLINRQHAVSEFFVPEALRKVEATGMSQSMRDDAATALEEMFAAAKEEGVTLSTVSGYRSYSKQSLLYDRKTKRTGSETEAGILGALTAQNAQVYFLQETDVDSTRTYGVNEVEYYRHGLSLNTAFAANYKVAFVPYPWPPIGKMHSGVTTLTELQVTPFSLPFPF